MPSNPERRAQRTNPLYHVSVRTRLALALSALVLLLVAMVAIGAWRLGEVNRVANNNLRAEKLLGEWAAFNHVNTVRAMVLASSDDNAMKETLRQEMATVAPRTTQLQKELEPLFTTPHTRALYQEMLAQRKRYLDLRARVFEQRKAGQLQEAQRILDEEFRPQAARYLAATAALVNLYADENASDASTAHSSAETGRQLLVACCAAGVVLAVLCALVIGSSIVHPLEDAVRVAESVAAGDLRSFPQPRGRDETARLLRALAAMGRGLRRTLSDVAQGARTVAASSAQIAQGSQDLSQRTEEQASTLEETASQMEELTSTVGQNAEHARHASLLAVSASDLAGKGGEVVGRVVTTMTGISEASRKISDITGVIDAIAFQTNILALNAAVEAARAGEQGRGFAVVAAEVRHLAQRSAAAAKEIKALIGDSLGQVEEGTRMADAAGRTMGDIVASVKQVSDLVAEIAAASREQSTGIEQVASAVSQMDQVVQQNAALVEESTAAAESMKEQSALLLQNVSRFRLDEGEEEGGPAAAVPPRSAPAVAAIPQPVAPIVYQPARTGTREPAAPARASGPRQRATDGRGWIEF